MHVENPHTPSFSDEQIFTFYGFWFLFYFFLQMLKKKSIS